VRSRARASARAAALAAIGGAALLAACGGGGSGAKPAPVETDLAIKASNILYDRTTLDAAAGTVKVTFQNADQGVTHDFHLYVGADASGQSVGQTAIATGPDTQMLVARLTAGSYFYHCDVHPATMHGVLTVH
jgi:plastocyanin